MAEHERCHIELALFVKGFRDPGFQVDLLTVASCALLPLDLVRVRTRPCTHGFHALAAAGPSACVTIIPREYGNIYVAIFFPNLLKFLPPTTSGSNCPHTITNSTILGSAAESQHLPIFWGRFLPGFGCFPRATALPGLAESPDFRYHLNRVLTVSLLDRKELKRNRDFATIHLIHNPKETVRELLFVDVCITTEYGRSARHCLHPSVPYVQPLSRPAKTPRTASAPKIWNGKLTLSTTNLCVPRTHNTLQRSYF